MKLELRSLQNFSERMGATDTLQLGSACPVTWMSSHQTSQAYIRNVTGSLRSLSLAKVKSSRLSLSMQVQESRTSISRKISKDQYVARCRLASAGTWGQEAEDRHIIGIAAARASASGSRRALASDHHHDHLLDHNETVPPFRY